MTAERKHRHGAGDSRRPGGAEPRPLVEWEGGVHLAGTPLWCDARHARDICFLSSARVRDARTHGQIIATQETIRLLSTPQARQKGRLTVPYGRPFALGPLRVELFPAGHALGSASLVAEGPEGRVAYAGTVGPGGPLFPAAEVRPCDAVIVDASHADQRHRFPSGEEMADAIRRWVCLTLAVGATPVLLAEPLGRAPDLVHLLATDVPVRAHPVIVATVRRLRGMGIDLPPIRRLAGAPVPGEVVLWPIARRDPTIGSVRRAQVALVDGRAIDPKATCRLGAEVGFPWSDRLDRDGLLAYLEQTGARQVYLLGGAPEGVPGRPLGQLELFR